MESKLKKRKILDYTKANSIWKLLEIANQMGIDKSSFVQILKEDVMFYLVYERTVSDNQEGGV